MKKIIIIAGIAMVVSINATAQIQRSAEAKTNDTTVMANPKASADKQNRKERFRELNLSKEQKGQLKGIMQTGKNSKTEIENNEQLSDADKKTQLHELKKNQAQKILAILTPEQREKYNQSKMSNNK